MVDSLLIIDDDQGDRLLVKEALVELNYKGTIHESASGEDGIEKAKTVNPQIVFIDRKLNGIDGIETCKQLRALGSKAKIIILTGFMDSLDGDLAKQVGANEYYVKTWDFKRLVNLIRKIIEEIEKENMSNTSQVTKADAKKESNKPLDVLIVDDVESNRDLLGAIIESQNHRAFYAIHGKDAVEKFESRDFDLCLMDIDMPIMDGLQATDAIRNDLKKKTPIFVVTAAVSREEECHGHEIQGFFTKPVDIIKLNDLIRKYCP